MKIFVVSLKKSVERRASIEAQLEKAGVDYEIIDAIAGSSLTHEELTQLVDNEAYATNPRWLNRSAIGCAASHLLCYKAMIAQGLSRGLILEDDMILNTSFFALLSSIELISLEHLSVVLLYYRSDHNRATKLKTETQVLGIQGFSLVSPLELSDHLSCAGAYIISIDACKSLLSANYPIRFAADSWVTFLQLRALKKVYAVYPRVCSGAEFDSTIEYAQAYYNPCLRQLRRIINRFPVGLLKKKRRRSIEKRMSRFIIYNTPN